MSNNPWDIGGDAGNSFPFDNIGDTVTGQIVGLTEQQQTDMQTGEGKTFANGDPMMMYKVTLATQLRDPDKPLDDGHREIYLKGSRKSGCQSSLAAVLDAVKAATGSSALEPNATLTLQYVGDGVATQRGFNPPKLYAAAYVRPTMDLAGPQQPAPVQPVAYAPQAVQQAPVQPVQAAPVMPQPIQQAPAPAAPAGPTPEQIAAVRAAGVDPATVFPGFAG